jgi:hypothetical protein
LTPPPAPEHSISQTRSKSTNLNLHNPQFYHSIHARGEDVDAILAQAEAAREAEGGRGGGGGAAEDGEAIATRLESHDTGAYHADMYDDDKDYNNKGINIAAAKREAPAMEMEDGELEEGEMEEEEDDGGGGGGSGGGINDDERDSVSVRHTVPQGGRTQLHHQYQPQIGPQLPVTKVAPADPPPPASEADHIPLNLACLHQSTEVAALLLEKHAKLLPDAEGLYPQHLVARSSNTDQLLLLLKMHGADLNQRDKLYSWTPLFHAASEGRVTCLRALLANGADPNALDEKGLTAMYYATWEGHLKCMDLLWESSSYTRVGRSPLVHSTVGGILTPQNQANSTDLANSTAFGEVDGIPDLSLPPPIIPLRRYGHNFLDKKTFISISFEKGPNAIQFFNEARYPAARISISCKTSDLIPRSLMLPIREDFQAVSFQIDSLEVFTVEFEIFPTFGSKVIAKSVALPDVFRAVSSSSGTCCLPLFDPRLRAVGQIQFAYQVIKPYDGTPLEITQFAPYWKATSALDDQNGLVTGSSLSGDYLSIYV